MNTKPVRKRILIIGGTGMLSAATTYFIEQDWDVTLVARTESTLQAFKKQHPNKTIHTIVQDYSDMTVFIDMISRHITNHGPFDTVIAWIHSHAQVSVTALIDLLSRHNPQTRFFHLKGSASYNPAHLQINTADTEEIDYREIILGFKHENGVSRWLADTEISQGMITAIETNTQRFVIGMTEPWDMRP